MRKSLGQCCYCRRELEKPTKDHVMPRSVGGRRKVRCCRQCNQLKGDLHPSAWRWFTETFPGWWRTFRTHRDVLRRCEDRFGRNASAAVSGRVRREDYEAAAMAAEAGV